MAAHRTDSTLTGVRRGTRRRYKPLDHWRLEKVVYGRLESGTSYVPQIKEIVRVSVVLVFLIDIAYTEDRFLKNPLNRSEPSLPSL